jgi:hypothetical protein
MFGEAALFSLQVAGSGVQATKIGMNAARATATASSHST